MMTMGARRSLLRSLASAASVVVALLCLGLAGFTFAQLALAMAGRLRAELTLALANLVYLLLLVGGAFVIPLDRYPVVLQPLLMLLPTAALGESLRGAAFGLVLGWPVLVLVVWS